MPSARAPAAGSSKPTVTDWEVLKDRLKPEMTCVDYISLVAGSLIRFAERHNNGEKRTAAAWRKEYGRYLNSRTRKR